MVKSSFQNVLVLTYLSYTLMASNTSGLIETGQGPSQNVLTYLSYTLVASKTSGLIGTGLRVYTEIFSKGSNLHFRHFNGL